MDKLEDGKFVRAAEIEYCEDVHVPISAVVAPQEVLADFSEQEGKKIYRKIDRRLVLTLGLMYAVSLQDRNNTGIALIGGMGTDLTMVGMRYSIVILVFFVPYTLLQPLATGILRRVGPRNFLAGITLLWGLLTMASGFVREWSDLIPLRIILGACEAGFFPSCAYLLSCWYPRYQLQRRNAAFYLIGTMCAAFAGILAYAFSLLNGHGVGPAWWGKHDEKGSGIGPGISGWRWIFILQGVLTCAVGVIGYFLIVGFPDRSDRSNGMRFLSERESAFVIAKIEEDRHDAIPEPFSLKTYASYALDLKIWGFASLFCGATVNTYSIAYFQPLILKDMGFSVAAAQCLTAPPYVLAAIVMFTIAWFSDKHKIRFPFLLTSCCILLTGLTLIGFAKPTGARYLGCLLSTVGCNSAVPTILTWNANTVRGQWKRALSSALMVGSGGIGGIIGSTVFRSQDAPGYRPGIIVTMCASVLMMMVTGIMALSFWRANKRASEGRMIIEGLPGFRYTL